MKKILMLTLAGLAVSFIFGTVFAEDKKETPKTEHKCSCGCMEGKECTCKADCKCGYHKDKDAKAGCDCQKDAKAGCDCKDAKTCDCGCKDGKDCKCKDHKKEMKGGSCHSK